MTLAKGYLGARWLATDPNGDALSYNVEIRGVHETEWKPLKDKVADKYLAWDSTAFPMANTACGSPLRMRPTIRPRNRSRRTWRARLS